MIEDDFEEEEEEYISFPVEPNAFLMWLAKELSEQKTDVSSLDMIEFISFVTGTFLTNYDMLHQDIGTKH